MLAAGTLELFPETCRLFAFFILILVGEFPHARLLSDFTYTVVTDAPDRETSQFSVLF